MDSQGEKMKIIVMSDSHGNYRALENIFENYYADIYIHLGDGERELNRICEKFPEKKIMHTAGNCDLASLSPDHILFSPDDKHTIFAAHGHKLAIKYSLEIIKKDAKKAGADIVLYGHSHERHMEYCNGMYIMNPGSASCPRDGNRPSFGIIEITDAGVMTNIVDL